MRWNIQFNTQHAPEFHHAEQVTNGVANLLAHDDHIWLSKIWCLRTNNKVHKQKSHAKFSTAC